MESRGLTEAQVRQRAHQIWLMNGGLPGHEMDDWLRAERELKESSSEPDVEMASNLGEKRRIDREMFPNEIASFAWFWGGPR